MLILILTLHLSEFERHVRASHVVSNVCRVTYGLIYCFHYRFSGFKFGTNVNLDLIEEKRSKMKGVTCTTNITYK